MLEINNGLTALQPYQLSSSKIKKRNPTYLLTRPSVTFSSGGVTPRLWNSIPLPEAMAAFPYPGAEL